MGSNWNTRSDELFFDFDDLITYAKSLPITKRALLKLPAKIFDPLGFLSPFTIRLKVMFQILCCEKIDWDEELHGDSRDMFNSFVTDLQHLSNVRVTLDNSIPDNEIHVIGYDLIRNDRNRYGGGVVLYVRDNIPFSVRNDLIPNHLEMVCIEVSRPYNKSFLISTWYRPPNSNLDIFDEWALFLSKCDNKNYELIIIGDFNCDVGKSPPDHQTQKLQFICCLYQIDQLITEPTRVTPTSATIIDLILTNRSENISESGVIHLGISDHSLVYLVRKFTPPKSRKTAREIRNFKNFVESDFIQDISMVPWDMIYQSDNPNICWQIWKSLFLEVLDRHAPLRRKRLRDDPVPWITPHIKQLMRRRDFHKKQAVKHNSKLQWESYKAERNKVNIQMRQAKSKYFCDKIQNCSHSKDVKKSWSLINTLLGRKQKLSNVKQLTIDDTIISDDKLIAESFNEYFINVGINIGTESEQFYEIPSDDQIPESGLDHSPNTRFKFANINVSNVATNLSNLKSFKGNGNG